MTTDQSAPTGQQAVPVSTAFCSLAPHSFVYDVYNFNCIVCDSFQHNTAQSSAFHVMYKLCVCNISNGY